MKLTKHSFLPLGTLAIAAAMLLSACNVQPEVTDNVPTLAPEVVHVTVAEDTSYTQLTPTPSPEATPEPTATPLPFSHYAPTVNMSYEELVGSTTDMKVKARDILKDGYPDPKTYYIIVDLQWQVVMVYRRMEDGSSSGKPDYDQPVRYMLCSTGNPEKEYGNETQVGTFAIEPAKERFWQFVNLEAAQYLTLIRSRTYFHSVLYKKANDLSTLVRETYDNLGKKDSHACIRLTVPDARWIFYNIGYGTTCEIRVGDVNDTRTATIRSQLILPPSKDVRLKASDDLWTDNWRIEDVPHELAYKYMEPRKPDMGEGNPADTGGTPPADAGGTTGGGDTTGGGTTVGGGDTTGGTTGGDSTGGTTTGGDTSGGTPDPGGPVIYP